MNYTLRILATTLLPLASLNAFAEMDGMPPQQGAQQQHGAQQGAPDAQPHGPAQGSAAADVSDTELKKFVEAEQKVLEVRDEYQEKITAVSDEPAEAMAMQQEAQEKMVEAVQDTGMEVDAYNRIVQLASTNPELMQRLQEMR